MTTRHPPAGKRQDRLDRRRDIAASGLEPHRAPAAEQRHGLRLFDKPRRLGGDRLAFEPRQRERIVDVVDRGFDDGAGAFADETGIRTEHQHHRPRRIGTRDESVDIGGFDGNH